MVHLYMKIEKSMYLKVSLIAHLLHNQVLFNGLFQKFGFFIISLKLTGLLVVQEKSPQRTKLCFNCWCILFSVYRLSLNSVYLNQDDFVQEAH